MKKTCLFGRFVVFVEASAFRQAGLNVGYVSVVKLCWSSGIGGYLKVVQTIMSQQHINFAYVMQYFVSRHATLVFFAAWLSSEHEIFV